MFLAGLQYPRLAVALATSTLNPPCEFCSSVDTGISTYYSKTVVNLSVNRGTPCASFTYTVKIRLAVYNGFDHFCNYRK